MYGFLLKLKDFAKHVPQKYLNNDVHFATAPVHRSLNITVQFLF